MPERDEMRYFEDLSPGLCLTYGTCRMEEGALLAFARAHDPQPMHLDPHSEQGRPFGGLIASGWHTGCLNMRMLVDGFLRDSSCIGAPGVRSLKWLKPVRAGDALTGSLTVLEARASTSKPDRGVVEFRFDVTNQDGQVVLEQINPILFMRREAGAPPQSGAGAPAQKAAPQLFVPPPSAQLGYAQDIVPGTGFQLGERHFTREDIIDFARDYDPQAFHLEEEAGQATHFGGLVASGWQSATGWMRLIVDYWKSEARSGRFVPKLGPSPGFTDMVWLKPVRPGDTLRYFWRFEEARLSASRPGWGLVRQRSFALNQHDEAVFAFTGTVLWEARP